MKSIKMTLAAIFLFMGASQLKAQQADINTILKFKNDKYDMGKIPYGKPSLFTIDIENISKDTVVLENVMVGCGCTTPKFNKGERIAPGNHGSVELGFNGSALGVFTKSATIFFNKGLNKLVSFSGEGIKQP